MGIFLIVLLIVLLQLALSASVIPLPVNDTGTVRYNTIPFATIMLIVLNSVIFIAWQFPDLFKYIGAQDPYEEYDAIYGYVEKIGTYGFQASFLRDGVSIGAFTTFTSTFMHGDLSHLIGNMVFLWAFGRRVEDACGPWRFLLFYLFAGMVAAMGFAFLAPGDGDVPGIGASGAIFGVMGAYLILFPGAKMGCLWILGIMLRGSVGILMRLIGERPGPFQWTINLPAFVVLVLYAGFNLLPTFRTVQEGTLIGGVNYVAHMTGFLSAVLIFLFVRKDLLTRYFAGRRL